MRQLLDIGEVHPAERRLPRASWWCPDSRRRRRPSGRHRASASRSKSTTRCTNLRCVVPNLPPAQHGHLLPGVVFEQQIEAVAAHEPGRAGEERGAPGHGAITPGGRFYSSCFCHIVYPDAINYSESMVRLTPEICSGYPFSSVHLAATWIVPSAVPPRCTTARGRARAPGQRAGVADIRIVSCEVSARRQIPARSKNDRIRPLDDPRLIPRLPPARPAPARAIGRGVRAGAGAGRAPDGWIDPARADEAYDLLDRCPQEAVQVMLTYGA